MRWAHHNLFWGRPLKSMMCLFDGSHLKYNFFHLKSSNKTFINKNDESKTVIFKNFASYKNYFLKFGIIVDDNERKLIIKKI